MAHKTQVEINGEMTEVFEFDHSAQEIDDAVEQVLIGGGGSGSGGGGAAVLYTAQSLTTSQQQQARQNIGAVSKSGDTMTGNLMVAKSSPYLHLKNTGTGRTARMAATSDNYLSLYNEVTDDASKNRAALWLGPETNNADRLLSVNHILNGTTTTYTVLHTGNSNRSKLVADDSLPEIDGEIYWRYK